MKAECEDLNSDLECFVKKPGTVVGTQREVGVKSIPGAPWLI